MKTKYTILIIFPLSFCTNGKKWKQFKEKEIQNISSILSCKNTECTFKWCKIIKLDSKFSVISFSKIRLKMNVKLYPLNNM
jgi:aspartate carbamoyltransferase regulatory subunit